MKITIVNEQDEIIGTKERDDVQQNDIYRVTGLWIKNSKDEFLICQRKHDKKNDPDKWTMAVAGTVEEGETYEENIVKETEEELGLENIKMTLGPKVRAYGKHNFFVQIFIAKLEMDTNKINFDKSEIERIRWIPKEDLIKDVESHPENYTENFPRYLNILHNIK